MVKRFLLFLATIGFGACLQAQPDTQLLSAFVDSTEVTLNDLITLTIRVDSSLGTAQPSLAGLNRDFEQVGNVGTRASYTNINGTVQSFVDYIIRLRPLSTGTLTIPAFRINGEVTTPIRMNVGEADQLSGAGNDEIFILSEVSKEQIFVQEQLLYTIKLYYSISFDQGAQLTSPQVADSVVQQLGSDQTYSEIVNGIRYNVTERNFVIFPQSSGELTIPPVYFSATVGRRGNFSRFFNNRSSVREINLASDTHIIDVQGKPSTFPGQTWLPAADLTIEENWSGPLDNLAIGESVTRNIRITATGLSSSLLPGIEYAPMDGLKFYPDQPVREDTADASGVIGTRAEGTAIVPSESGEFVLPEVSIPWWNTRTNRLEQAVIPSRVLSVLPGAPGTQPQMPDLASLRQGDAAGAGSGGSNAVPRTSNLTLFWIGSTTVFAIAWLFSTAMWLRNRRMLAFMTTATPAMMPQSRQAASEAPADADSALKILKRACQHTDLGDIRRSLLTWGQALYQDKGILSLAQLKARSGGNAEFVTQADALEQQLYSGEAGGSPFDPVALMGAVTRLHKQGGNQGKRQQADYSLPPLYRN